MTQTTSQARAPEKTAIAPSRAVSRQSAAAQQRSSDAGKAKPGEAKVPPGFFPCTCGQEFKWASKLYDHMEALRPPVPQRVEGQAEEEYQLAVQRYWDWQLDHGLKGGEFDPLFEPTLNTDEEVLSDDTFSEEETDGRE